MTRYSRQTRMLIAVDCIIFGFDGQDLKLLLIKRGFEPEKGKWSLMGGFVQQDEGLEEAATRTLTKLTGLNGVFMEQLNAYGGPNRDPAERTLSVAYYALIDINQYKQQLSEEYKAEWFPLREAPKLIFDHAQMVAEALARLRYKAAIHPLLFELLPAKFTIPQLQILFEAVYDAGFDKRNFSRKVLSTGLLIKQKEKERATSKRGAFYYKLDKRKYSAKFHAFLNFVSDPGNLK
ncbi:NUDIX hydrolase [Chitinophaga sancti]|uniref:ADP-ribose pyrophosphatase YjhB, NUDIX family n=1 Tax=Chitinophaga sancti TaxID=1004 RepID=A0A1K1ND68_9BACT|nr:NUDIX domain-containing protein [Chitinophaga sancti]WQD63315.1 NUDIX domain-containing protein [Chitinophaga sancti]WQG91059.1 NUDIX domain-containing protein [Chitinophaga sancti]SFW33287.1 ADP-ribose pyrophosphatase YjhB, NUDIX family [Chitinophaga sancti]